MFIDFLVLSWLLLFTESFDLSNGLMVSGAICLVRVYVCLALLELDRNKVKILREELYRVIRDKPAEKTAEDEEDDT